MKTRCKRIGGYQHPVVNVFVVTVENGMGATAGGWEDNGPFATARTKMVNQSDFELGTNSNDL